MASQAILWYNTSSKNVMAQQVRQHLLGRFVTSTLLRRLATVDIVSQKVCSKCGKTKPLTAFHKDKTKPDGYYPSCRDCKQRSFTFTPTPITSKQCTLCKEVLPVEAFSKNPKHSTGYRSQCKECRKNVEYAQWREKHPKVYAKYTSDEIPRGFKMCMSCDEIKPTKEFFRDRTFKDGFIRYCKECRKKYRKTPVQSRKQRLKSAFNLTLEQYDDMLQSQNGVCAICKQPPKAGEYLKVDHCHQTDRVRELLCHHCNCALGLMKEDPERIQSLLAYALKYKSIKP